MQNDIERRLKEDASADLHFTTMVDLYALYCDSQLQKVADSVDSPELIDDGQHSAPSKRIIEQIPAYKRLKTSVGPQMAADIGLRAIRLKCPHFDAWISRLEGLGGG